jgi:hypothetical protein
VPADADNSSNLDASGGVDAGIAKAVSQSMISAW